MACLFTKEQKLKLFEGFDQVSDPIAAKRNQKLINELKEEYRDEFHYHSVETARDEQELRSRNARTLGSSESATNNDDSRIAQNSSYEPEQVQVPETEVHLNINNIKADIKGNNNIKNDSRNCKLSRAQGKKPKKKMRH